MIRPPRVTEARRARGARKARQVAAVLAMMLATAATRSARAEDPPAPQVGSSSIAERLFVEGKALMLERQYQRACEKLKASYDLDRTATGTLLNLALCHEQISRPATAWAEFRQVAAESAGRREDRVTLAREHEARLLPILSQVEIVVRLAARADGLRLKLDGGVPIGEAAWGTEVPIDPGSHTVEASAPGKLSRSVQFVVGAVSDRQTVIIEVLLDAPRVDEAQQQAERARLAELRGRRVVGYTLGGVGLVAAGVGLALGGLASSKNSDVVDGCPNDACPSTSARDDAQASLSSAKTLATISTVTVVAGGAMLIAGAALVLTSRAPTSRAASTAAALRILPAPLVSGGGIFLSGEL